MRYLLAFGLCFSAFVSSVCGVTDGFDYPLRSQAGQFYVTQGIDGDGYYNAQDFGVNNHLGEDWNGEGGENTDCGHTVYAVAQGTIVYARAATGWGNVLIVRHDLPNGGQVETLYGHLQSFLRTSGSVARNESIATIGDGGGLYYCHLHFELRYPHCAYWRQAGPGYSSDKSGWTDPSDFIDAHRPGSGSGYCSVSDGVTVTPSTVILGQGFQITFTLKETRGHNKTFESVAVAILDSNGGFVFDFAMYNNVFVSANGTWGIPASNYIYASRPPGTYQAMIRGKVDGQWFDFDTTGGGVNPRVFTAIDGSANTPTRTPTGGPTSTPTRTPTVPEGYCSISEGVTISPSTVTLDQDFQVSFTLKETRGYTKSFEEVAIEICDANDNLIFDFEVWGNVVIGENASWTRTATNRIFSAHGPGTYKARVMGKLLGGERFLFDCVGIGVNPRVFNTVAPTNTPTQTVTRTHTPTHTYTRTPTRTYTPTRTPTGTDTPTFTTTNTPSPTPTHTPTPTFTLTYTHTPTYTPTEKFTETPTETPTFTPTDINVDFNDDGDVDAQDLHFLVQHFGTDSLEFDLNRDGIVDHEDLFIFSRYWMTGK